MPGWAAAAGVAMSAVSTGVQAGTAGDAAGGQAAASRGAAQQQADYNNRALTLQQQQMERADSDVRRFILGGQVSQQVLQDQMGVNFDAAGNATFNPNALLSKKYDDFSFNLSDFNRDPSYAFRTQEGVNAITAGGAATGGLSGNMLKALTDYGQASGSQEYQNAYGRAQSTYGTNAANFYGYQDSLFNRLSSMAGSGQNAALGLGALGMSGATGIAQTLANGGNAAASGTIGAGNAIAAGKIGSANAMGGVGSSLNMAQFMSKMNGGSNNSTGIGQGLSNWFSGKSWGDDGGAAFNTNATTTAAVGSGF